MISLLLILSLAHAAPAKDTCSSVDLREKFGPVRDQGPMDSCYAFMSADLLAATAPEPLKSPLSAIQVAANFAARTHASSAAAAKKTDVIKWYSSELPREEDQRTFQDMHGKKFEERINVGAGQLSLAIAESMDKPLCLESELPSEPKTRHQADKATLLTDKLDMSDDGDDKDAYDFLYRSMREPEKSLIPELPETCKVCEKTKSPTLPKFTKTDLNPAVRNWAAPLIAKKMTAQCKMKITIPSARVRDTYVDFVGAEELANLDSQLSKGNPVGIGYNVCDFMKPSDTAEKREGCPHASSIVGRKRNKKTGTCEYLVRNSYGEQCEGYNKGVVCDKGYFWMSEKKLKDSVVEMVWVDRKK